MTDGSEFDLYGVKIVYKYTVQKQVFYEESVLRIKAGSFDEALAKAQAYAGSYVTDDHKHVNKYGKVIHKEIARITDVYGIYDIDEEDGVCEVWSNIMMNRTSLSDSEFTDALCEGCTAEEMVPLRAYGYLVDN